MEHQSKLTLQELLLSLHRELVDHELPLANGMEDTRLSVAELAQGFDVIFRSACQIGDRSIAYVLDELTTAATAAANKDEWQSDVPTVDRINAAVSDVNSPKLTIRDVLVFFRTSLLKVPERIENGVDPWDISQVLRLVGGAANQVGDQAVAQVVAHMADAIVDALEGTIRLDRIPNPDDIDRAL